MTIEYIYVIYLLDAILEEQNTFKPPPPDELSKIIAEKTKANPAYIFTPLTIGKAWYIAIDGIRIGERLNHGNGGKRGLSFPSDACGLHTSEQACIDHYNNVKAYFTDLDQKSRYSDRCKQAGIVKQYFFLY